MITALAGRTPARTRYRGNVRAVTARPVPTTGLFVLKPGWKNEKMGQGTRHITKGRYRGMSIYGLTLEERATCWEGCQNWDRCYGNNMFRATRYMISPDLLPALEADVERLTHRRSVAVRLHVLGDFFSVPYVEFWGTLAQRLPRLHVFGYTHWPHGSPIGDAVTQLVHQFPAQVSLLRSDGDATDPLPRAVTIERGARAAPGTVICPAQTHERVSCTTCGLCMNGRTSVSFIDHSRN